MEHRKSLDFGEILQLQVNRIKQKDEPIQDKRDISKELQRRATKLMMKTTKNFNKEMKE